MKKVVVTKKPIPSEVYLVTKDELEKLSNKYQYISIGSSDKEFLAKAGDGYVGVLAGEMDEVLGNKVFEIGDKIPDVWFVNMEYYVNNYDVLEEYYKW